MNSSEPGAACLLVRDQLGLMLYGELSFDEEEAVETHLEACAECRTALERQQELHAALDRVSVEPPASILRESRAMLFDRIAAETYRPETRRVETHPSEGWWDKLVGLLTVPPSSGWLKPAGALTLVAMGFMGARVLPSLTSSGGLGMMGLADAGASKVRYVEPAADGRVQIVIDETRQKVLSGNLDNPQIRAMLLAAARDSSDPGIRVETVDFLIEHASSKDVRDVLIAALRNDQNAGVRLKAMEGLKAFAKEPGVRSALAQVLLSDGNPGVRTQAIDLLTEGLGMAVDRDIVGSLQELMVKENNPYVREKCQAVLASWNASAEIY